MCPCVWWNVAEWSGDVKQHTSVSSPMFIMHIIVLKVPKSTLGTFVPVDLILDLTPVCLCFVEDLLTPSSLAL